LRKTLHELERITPSCHCCLHLGAGKVCERFHAEPPPDWQRGPVDCAHWEYDNVPF
jgi:hypothetical protein